MVLEKLRAVIFEAVAEIEQSYLDDDADRHIEALEGIHKILEGRSLASFPAARLEVLELLVSYWREAEVEVLGAAVTVRCNLVN